MFSIKLGLAILIIYKFIMEVFMEIIKRLCSVVLSSAILLTSADLSSFLAKSVNVPQNIIVDGNESVSENNEDYQFIDEEGNIYPISEEPSESVYRACSHTYSSGTISKHEKNSNGGCVVKTYKAQRCTKCGDTIWGEQVGWNQYDVCPH